MPITAVEPVRLYRQIADQIATLIDRGEYAAGARLPAERELAKLLGVSRTSVREAIICLELAGRIEVRVGTGIFVAEREFAREGLPRMPSDRSRPDAGPGPFELLAARSLIEGEIAALAARHLRKRDLAHLRDTMVQMREHADDTAVRDGADRAFHVGIAEATGNGSLALVVDGMWDQRRGELWTRIESHFHTPELRAKTLADHAAIVAALEARDPDDARAAMHRHLGRVAREFQRQWEGQRRTYRPARPTQGSLNPQRLRA